MATFLTNENMIRLLDAMAEGWSMPKASAIAFGQSSKVAFVYFRNARRERESNVPIEEAKHVVRDWPSEGEINWLDHAAKMSADMATHNLHSQTIEMLMHEQAPILEGGRVMYQIDAKAIAEWDNAEDAYTLGGIEDWPFAHDESGARIPLMRREFPGGAALRIAALKALAGSIWNVPEKIDVNKKTTKAVYVIGENKRQQQTDSPLRADLKTRLAELRAKGPQHPKPDSAVQVFRAVEDGPKERVSNQLGDDACKPLSTHPRAYQAPAALPPPKQEPVSYARPSKALDAQDRKSAMPSGGFSITRNARPT